MSLINLFSFVYISLTLSCFCFFNAVLFMVLIRYSYCRLVAHVGYNYYTSLQPMQANVTDRVIAANVYYCTTHMGSYKV